MAHSFHTLDHLALKPPTSPASESPGSGEKILRRGLEFAQKLLPLLMESHPSGDPVRRGKSTAQNRTPNPSFTFFREYRTSEMKRQTRFCRLFTVCLFVVSVNVVTNRKLTSYNAFLHRQVIRQNKLTERDVTGSLRERMYCARRPSACYVHDTRFAGAVRVAYFCWGGGSEGLNVG